MSLRPESDYIQLMSDRRVKHYRKFYGAKDNDWILQELEEWGDEVQSAALVAYEHGRMTKAEYQATVSAARSAWEQAFKEIEEYVKEEDYILRLSGQISPTD